jgi:hypothetical protein
MARLPNANQHLTLDFEQQQNFINSVTISRIPPTASQAAEFHPQRHQQQNFINSVTSSSLISNSAYLTSNPAYLSSIHRISPAIQPNSAAFSVSRQQFHVPNQSSLKSVKPHVSQVSRQSSLKSLTSQISQVSRQSSSHHVASGARMNSTGRLEGMKPMASGQIMKWVQGMNQVAYLTPVRGTWHSGQGMNQRW